jgi:hypothetical protein
MSPPRRRGRPGESDEPYEGRRKKEAVGGIAGMDEKNKNDCPTKTCQNWIVRQFRLLEEPRWVFFP